MDKRQQSINNLNHYLTKMNKSIDSSFYAMLGRSKEAIMIKSSLPDSRFFITNTELEQIQEIVKASNCFIDGITHNNIEGIHFLLSYK